MFDPNSDFRAPLTDPRCLRSPGAGVVGNHRRRALADITDWAARKGRAIDVQALQPAGPDAADSSDTDVDP